MEGQHHGHQEHNYQHDGEHFDEDDHMDIDINEIDVNEDYKGSDVYDDHGCYKNEEDIEAFTKDPYLQEIERDKLISFYNRLVKDGVKVDNVDEEEEGITSEMEKYIIETQTSSKMKSHLELLRKQKEKKFGAHHSHHSHHN